jgi:hypothetical protein
VKTRIAEVKIQPPVHLIVRLLSRQGGHAFDQLIEFSANVSRQIGFGEDRRCGVGNRVNANDEELASSSPQLPTTTIAETGVVLACHRESPGFGKRFGELGGIPHGLSPG